MTAREAGQLLGDAFHRAWVSAADQRAEHDYVIGGARTRLRVVGRDLARRLDEAFLHLRSTPGRGDAPDLCVDVWDASVSGIASPLDTWRDGDLTRAWDEGILTTADDDRHVVFERGQALTWLDRRTCRVVACRCGADTLPLIERAKPFAPVLPLWLGDRDVHAVHAALVATEGGGVLMTGGSGVGKTTCALLCLEAGFAYLGDDLVATAPDSNGGFTGHSLYGSSRLLTDHLERLPWLAVHAIPGRPPAEPKALVFVSHLADAELLGSVPLRVILLPRIVGTSTTRVRRAGKAEGFRALIVSSFLTGVPGPSRRSADILATLVDRIPAYHLDLGDDLKEIPSRVREALDEARG